MMITDTRTFLLNYVQPQQQRLRRRRSAAGPSATARARLQLGRALIWLGSTLSGEGVEPAGHRASPVRPG